jgi:Xaa-Pro aminopeptidase
LRLLTYDLEEWNERRIKLGPKAAAAKEAEEREAAETITHQVPTEFLGIGVRIEDDILITESGHVNMTDAVPREADEVEALCAEESVLPSS